MSDPLVAQRLRSQGLSGPPATSPEDVVRRLLAVQAQDPRGARLAVRSRSTGLTAADVDTALTERRSLVVSWLNRGTLHLVLAEDYWWLHPLTTPQLATSNATRLRQEGVSERQADLGVEVVRQAVADGPQTRDALRARLDEAGVPTARQALVHVLLATTLRTDLVRGPVIDGEQAFVSARAWLGPAPPLDRDEGLARLARRYLAGHAPAQPQDLAKWAGTTLGDARRGLAAIEDETVRDDAGLVRLADAAGRAPGMPSPGGPPDDAPPIGTPALPPPRLLGAFDPLLHGWVSREAVVGPHRGVVTSNGVFRPVALVDGRVVATWSLPAGVVTIAPLEPISDPVVRALRADARAVQQFLSLPERDAVVLP